ncbi:AAA family ATPase [Colletotrichum chrysophilum]|uniref:AAA family ATPase n=1 Tax=Colletotrichum chrysophilum TaxID=1836956 RepID=A0AAD9AKZ0_9PEZI|nr:AAA family ATPase [Colletotrichum chrysophilum]
MASPSAMTDPKAENASFSPMEDSREVRDLKERLQEVESKVSLVDIMYDLHKSATEGIMHKQHDPFLARVFSSRDSSRWGRYYGELTFLKDSVFFMQRIRESYQAILEIEKERDGIRENRRKRRQNAIESESARQISTKAFLNGERAKLSQSDWNDFIMDTGFEEAILYPIEVVIGEAEPRTILQLPGFKDHKPRPVERTLPINEEEEEETTRNQALPERIKIYSAPLMVIMSRLTNDSLWTNELGGSIVLLRPYQDLFYYEAQLRQWLTRLEKDFEGFDGSMDVTETFDGAANTNHITEVYEAPKSGASASIPDEKRRSVDAEHLEQSDMSHVFTPHGNNDEDSGGEDEDSGSSSNGSDDEEGDSSALEAKLANSITALVHLRSLVEFMNNEIKPKQTYVEGPVCGNVSFHDLWHLFKPGTEVIEQGGKQAFVVLRVEVPVHKIEEPWGRWSKKVADFKAMYYTGATLDKGDEIDSQVVVDFSEALADEERSAAWKPTIGPVNTAPEGRRDDECSALCCRGHIIHDGFSTDLKMTTDYIGTLVPDARARSLILSPRSLEETLGSIEELTETEILIMTYRVFGFVLRSRKWGKSPFNHLNSQYIRRFLARDLTIDAFERLELPEGHRELVQSLVTQHFRNRHSSFTKDTQTDLIQGKGKGLIMLLHGAPGVGKTTTAEGVAELFRKPLFQITCVFLRVLEYYTGILFLTTNRIGDLDEAFASRIQMSLHYPELDELKTLKVFRLHIDLIEQRFKKQGRTITFDISSIEDFASQHYADQPYNRWNGRQIRNACHTALALAEFDAQKNGSEISLEIDKSATVSLQLKYFKVVQKAYLDFGEYLADIQGTEGDDRAFQQRLRARKNTPFEKQSLFDARPGPGQRRRPRHANSRLSDMSPSFNTKTEVFDHDQHRHQRQYSSTASSQAQGYGNAAPYNQTPGGSFRDYGNSPAHDQQMHGQQAQTDTRFQMESQQAPLYESPQAGLQPAHSGEAHLRPSMSHDGFPLPHRPAQPQSMQYGYSSELQADAMRITTPRVQSDPRDIPHPGYTYRDGAQGGLNRVPYQGGNMPQT